MVRAGFVLRALCGGQASGEAERPVCADEVCRRSRGRSVAAGGAVACRRGARSRVACHHECRAVAGVSSFRVRLGLSRVRRLARSSARTIIHSNRKGGLQRAVLGMAAPPSPASSHQIPSGSTTSAGSSGGATASSKRKRRLHDLSTDEINEIVALRGKMSQAVVGKKYGIEQTEVSAIQRMQRVKIARLVDDNDKKPMVGRVKGVEVTIPIVYGSISFWLGKKAAESTHKWTTYVRSANNEDLSVLIKKVVFQLHPSFEKPTKTIEAAPFELSESGWGEFEIGITLYFHPDVGEKPLELFHHLKLYADDESLPQTTKKPVVVEAYDEIVLSEPLEASFARLRNHPVARVAGIPASPLLLPAGESSLERKAGDTKDHPLVPWFMKHSEAEDLNLLTTARQQVWAAAAKLKKELGTLENEVLRIKATTH